MRHERLREQVFKEWGSIVQDGVCPVWVSEFGADASTAEEMLWLESFVEILAALDADWAYWPLNVGPKPGDKSPENYGMLSPDWTPKPAGDPRLQLLEAIGLRPNRTTPQPADDAFEGTPLRGIPGQMDSAP